MQVKGAFVAIIVAASGGVGTHLVDKTVHAVRDVSERATEASAPALGVLIADLDGDGYQLTSAADGVRLDLDGSGAKVRVGWTASGANDGFIAMDLNSNSRIDDARELFGTSFLKSDGNAALNGFDALVDLYIGLGVQKGGLLDSGDSIYPRLLLWIDGNHNGIAEPAEVRTLQAAGIKSVATMYHGLKAADQLMLSGNSVAYLGNMFVSKRGVDFPRPIAHVRLAMTPNRW